MPELHFDGSLEALARFERAIAVCAGLATLLAVALYVRVERVARRLWAGVAVERRSVGSPYRAETLVVERLGRAPLLPGVAIAFGTWCCRHGTTH